MWMARLYALLTVVSALAIVGAGLIRVIVHFMLKVRTSRLRALLQALIHLIE